MDTSAVDAPLQFLDRAVYLSDSETLVLADVHLGRGAASAVDAPIDDGGDVIDRLDTLLASTEPATVVVAGDLLHSFSQIPRGVEDDLDRLAGLVDRAGASLVVTRGNHDRLLESVFDGQLVDAYRLPGAETTIVCHGHEVPETAVDPAGETIELDTGELPVDRYVIGHDHPAIEIAGRKRPCFCYGPATFRGADVLVLPAVTRLARGTRINRLRGQDCQSPLVADLDPFHPIVWDADEEEPLWFPPLGECRQLL